MLGIGGSGLRAGKLRPFDLMVQCGLPSANITGQIMEKAGMIPRDLLMKALKVFVSDAILRSAAGLSGFVAFTNLHLP